MTANYSTAFKALFAGSYLFLILSTIFLFKSSLFVSDVLFILRVVFLILMLVLWLIDGAYRLKTNAYILTFSISFSPYLLTDAYMVYLDVMAIIVVAASLRNDISCNRFFVGLASASLILVFVVAALSWMGSLPTNVFEWDGRVKNSMGFTNPNTFYYYIFSASFVYYAYSVRLGFILCGALLVGLYVFVGSRTFLFSYCVLFLLWLRPVWLSKSVVQYLMWVWLSCAVGLGFLMAWVPVESAIVISAVTGVDPNELLSNRFNVIDEGTSGRSFLHLLLGGMGNAADSLYVYILNGVGVLGVLLLVPLFFGAILHASKRSKSMVLALSCVYCTIGIIEVPFDGAALIALVFVYILMYGDCLDCTGSLPRISMSANA